MATPPGSRAEPPASTPERLLYVDDAQFDRHVAVAPHPERPERLAAIRRGLLDPLQRAGAQRLASREATPAELMAAHAQGHIETLERALASQVGEIDEDTYFSEGSRRAAWLAAGSAAELATQLLAAPSAAGVLLARPPGHHATRTRSMGFCLLNNVAVAAYAALAAGAQRVAIVDFDVHHGNGTQDIFYDDPRVLFVSLHQWPLYPGSGDSHEVGHGAGLGSTVNLPLPSGSGGDEYALAFERVVEPVISQFAPELLLVSAGFDAHRADPLASMQLNDEDYGAMTSSLWGLAARLGAPRLAMLLEGGYSLDALERAGDRVAAALTGGTAALASGSANAAATRAIDNTRRALGPYFSL
jgi:acetoin utilization deacetylase AcuC-like enzyme